MKKVPYILLCIVFFSNATWAQIKVIDQGTITFEKKINNYALIKEIYMGDPEGQENLDNYKKKNPQFEVYDFQLSFAKDFTLYQPIGNMLIKSPIGQSTSNNIVYSDFGLGRFVSQKKIFNKDYVVKDVIRPIKWKFTNETREIAGYPCKRANGVLMDSIYVVAFYATDIVSNGGPELFKGLPGMILGLAIPDDHVTWFATKVQAGPVEINSAKITSKEAPLDWVGYQAFLNSLTRLGPLKNKLVKHASF